MKMALNVINEKEPYAVVLRWNNYMKGNDNP